MRRAALCLLAAAAAAAAGSEEVPTLIQCGRHLPVAAGLAGKVLSDAAGIAENVATIPAARREATGTARAVVEDLLGVESAAKLYSSLHDRWHTAKVAGAAPHTFDGKGHLFIKWSGQSGAPRAALYDPADNTTTHPDGGKLEPPSATACASYDWDPAHHASESGNFSSRTSRLCQVCAGNHTIQAEVPLNAVVALGKAVEHVQADDGAIAVTDEGPYGRRAPTIFVDAMVAQVAEALLARERDHSAWRAAGGWAGPRCRALAFLEHYHLVLARLGAGQQPTKYTEELNGAAVEAASKVLAATATFFASPALASA